MAVKGPLVSRAKNSRSRKVLMGLGGGGGDYRQAGAAVIGERQTAGGLCVCM